MERDLHGLWKPPENWTAATVTLFTLESSTRALKDPYIRSFWTYEFFQAWNSISFTLANQRPAAAQEILPAHFLSVREPYHALSLCLWWSPMLIHCSQPPFNISWNCEWAAPSPENEQKVHFRRSNVSCSEQDLKTKWLTAKYNSTFDLTLKRLFLIFFHCFLVFLQSKNVKLSPWFFYFIYMLMLTLLIHVDIYIFFSPRSEVRMNCWQGLVCWGPAHVLCILSLNFQGFRNLSWVAFFNFINYF